MKNLYFNSIVKKLKHLVVLLIILFGFSNAIDAQVRKAFTQRTSQYSPTRKIYNVKGDFTMLGNTNLTPQFYTETTNNNDASMVYVDIDGDSNTFNSSSSTLVIPSENGSTPECSNIVFAGLYWTGKSSASATFDVTKSFPSSQAVNNDYNVDNGDAITNTTYSLAVSRGGTNGDRYPIYTFSSGGTSYAFRFYNNGSNRVTVSVNGGAETNVPVSLNSSGSNVAATLNTPYVITNGTVSITIKKLTRAGDNNQTLGQIQSTSNADINVAGTITVNTNVTKTFNKRVVKLKGPTSASYTDITAATTDIYYPSGSDDNIYSAYAEITDYVRNNGVGQYTVADLALLEGNPGGTGYSGGWSIIVIYENSKMKWRDVTIFDGYAYVEAGNSAAGIELPINGFNAAQSGNVGMKIGVIASEGDIGYTSDYFKIRNLATNTYTTLSRTADGVIPSPDNFFRSYINAPGTRNPNLLNNTGIDIGIINIPNTNNSIIGNSQTSTKFLYGTNGDTYSIFGIAMSVDAYIPEAEGTIVTSTINNQPAVLPLTILPGQDAGFTIDVRNLGTEAISNFKVIVPIPYNATYVAGSATGTLFYTTPNPTTITGTFDPNLGATGSIVWNFGTLPLPANPSTLLATLTFKLKATTNCEILANSSCASTLPVNGSYTGVGATTNVALSSQLIQGHTVNGNCAGQIIPTPINIAIDGAAYVQQNCPGTDYTRHFSYCSASTTVAPSEIASNFPLGSQFYNTFPVTINSIQYTDANPIPLVAGSTVTYYAVPAGGGNGCNFPFTITKCPVIIAQNDALAGGNGTTGNPNIGNVLNNNGSGSDTLNGVQASISQVNITVTTPATSIGGNPVPSINTSTGQVSVPAGTPAGTYTIVYNLCEKLNPTTNCDPATVTITVTAPVIIAQNDTINGGNGTTGNPNAGNVLDNNGNGPDTLNGNPAAISQVNITVTSPASSIGGAPVPTLDTASGQISVPVGTPAGTYTITYNLCEKINPTNCDPATVTITVTAPAIIAQDDTINGGNGTTGNPNAGNVLNNNGNGPDTLNATPVTISQVNITITTPASSIGGAPVPVLATATGQVSVPAGTPAGTYTIVYNLCEKLNPTNCDPATVTITVTAPAIIAQDDTINGGNGTLGNPNAGNVLNNNGNGPDTLNGNPATIGQVNITVTTPATSIGGAPVPTLDTATGQISVPTGTPAGNYTIVYNLCEKLNPTNCDPATVTITVSPAVIIAQDDILSGGNGTTGNPNIGNVLNNNNFGNDVLNGVNAVIALVNISVTTPATSIGGAPVPVLATATGIVSVPPGTPAGTYTIVYNLCEKLNPTNCDPATVIITVTAPLIDAVNDTFENIVCPTSGTIANILTNDTLNSLPVLIGNVNLTVLTGSYPSVSIDNSGNIILLSGASCGQYSFTYRICEKLNPANCDTATVTVSIIDNTAPTWTTTATSLNATVECSDAAALAAAQALFPIAFDVCDTDVTNIVKVAGQFVASATCANAGSYTNTWTVSDACGNTSATFTQVITVQDTQAPTWTTAADSLNATVECSDAAALAAAQAQFPVAADLCDADVTNIVKVSGQFVASATCTNAGSYTNTWTVTDACQNTSATFTQVITVQDTQAPTWTNAATSLNATVECSDAAALAAAQAQFPVATDLCDADVTNIVKVSGQFVASATCANAGSYTNTWTVTDACQNTSATFTQVITVQDTQAPTWTTAADSLNATVECSDAAALAAAQAQFPVAADLCDADVTNIVKVSGQFVASATCANAGSYTNTWTVTDACQNTSATFTQVITVQDTQAPTWTTTADSLNATVECSDAAALAAAQAQFPVATDLCDADVTNIVKVSGQFVASATCANAGSYTNTWTVTDACQNTSATFTQVITVQDTQAPTWTTAADSLNATVECSDAAALAAAQAQFPVAADLCDADVTNIVKVSGQFVASATCANAGSYTNTWTVTDACQNTSATFTQVITVQDTQAPTWTTAADSLNATVECSDAAALAAAQAQFPVAADLCDADVTNIVKVSGQFVASATCANAGSYTNTWTVTDACQNTSATFTQVITVQDTQAPTWTTAADSLNATVECSDPTALALAQAQFPVAADLCDADVTNIVKVSGQFVASATCANAGSYTNTWTVTDACENTSATFTQVITVQDTAAPTWTTAADSLNATVECSDAAALAAAQAQFPVAADLCDADVTNIVKVSGQFVASATCANAGSYTNTWTVTDACGNTSATFTQVITVQDTAAPTWSTAADSLNATVECSDAAALAAAQAQFPVAADLCDADVTNIVKVSGQFVASTTCANAGSYTNTWTVTDACENTSATFTQVITVQDTQAPNISTLASNIIVECDGTGNGNALNNWLANHGGAIASDNCSDVTWTNNFNQLSGDCSAAVTVTFTATDACNNASVTTATFTVSDTIPPTFTAPANTEVFTTADCTFDASIAITGDVTDEADNCSPGLQATFTDSVTNTCTGSKVITRTWALVDACGNAAATQTQTITVTDNIAPTFTAPANIEISTTADCTYDATVAATGDVTNEADNCSTDLQATFTDSVADGQCAGSHIITRTWSLVDACGNAAPTQTQIITVIDNIAPTFTAPANTEVFTTADCTYDASVAVTGDVTNEADNCSTDLQATFTDSVADGQCAGSHVITRTWSLADACGNAAPTQTQIITVTDNIAPTFTAPANIEIFTTADCTYDATVAVTGDVTNEADNCSTDLQATFTDSVADGQCAGSHVITRTWSLVDACGNAAPTQTQIITVTDNIAPTFTAPANTEVFTTADCTYDATVAVTGDVTNEADNCSTDLQATFTDSVADGQCAGSHVITRTWSLVDACGNAAPTQTQIITVSDNIAPTFTAPANTEVFTTADCTYDASVAVTGDVTNEADNCSTDLQATFTDSVADGQCAGSHVITRTWSLVDACGNAAPTQTQIITVTDNIAPVFSAQASSIVVECDGSGNQNALTDWLNNHGGAVASDNCSDVTWSNNFSNIANDCSAAVTVVFTATDACNNASTSTATFTINDTVAPTFTAPANTEVFTTADCNFDASVAVTGDVTNEADNCSAELQATFTDSVADGQCAGSKIITRTWSLVDTCGNAAATQTQIITVTDNIAPVAPEAPASVSVACSGDVPAMVSLTALDNCAGEITVSGVDTVVPGSCPNSFTVTRTWTFTDACNNTSSVTQTISVNDTIVPTFTAPANTEIFTTADCTYDASVAITGDVTNEADNCSADLQATFTDSVADGACAGSHIITRTWSLVDACGNAAATQTQTITVTDNTAPVVPEAPASLAAACSGEVPAMISLTAIDNCSGEITVPGIDTVVQGSCPNSFTVTRTWTFTDACNNTSSVTQTITVNDNIVPTFTAPANIEVFTAADCSYDASVAVTGDVTDEADNCSTDLQATFTDSVADGACAGSHIITRTWSLVDACGNAAPTQTQIITVSDNIAPTFTAPADIQIAVGTECTYDASIGITGDVTDEADNCSTGLQATFTDSIANGDCPSAKIITRTWSLVDACGNAAATQVQTITVNDNSAPVTPQAPAPISSTCTGDVPAMISLTAMDNCSGAITVLGVDNTVQGSCPNSFTVTRTWTFTDACNNTSSVSQTISVNDNVPPSLSQAAPANTAASCDNIPAPAVLTAIDNCGTATVNMTETILAGSCPSNYTITRTWVATDACGNNSAPVSQTINVSDTVGPHFITEPDAKINIGCGDEIPVAPVYTPTDFTDNCSTVGTPVFTETQTQPVNNNYVITRTWTVADACGNTYTFTQHISVSQGTAPIDVTIPDTVEICNDEVDATTDLAVYLPTGTPTGGTWVNESNVGTLTGSVFASYEVAEGSYTFSYTYETENCPQKVNILVPVKECGIVEACLSVNIHNAFTPNNDANNLNEFFNIENIDDTACYPTNSVEIYNRWGVLVYETKNYDNNTRKFTGVSEGRATVNKSQELPTGTYFYIIQWTTTTGQTESRDGYLYLTR